MSEENLKKDASCPICLDILFKPCVNCCGHTSCFWCTHRGMGYFKSKHACPLCRAEFVHFPAICLPLHRYLAHKFPAEIAIRQEETKTLEEKEYHAESSPVGLGDEKFDVKKDFACVACGNMAAPPAVLSCGHVVCCPGTSNSAPSSSKSQGDKQCPVPGCVGRVVSESGSPAVCALIDTIQRQELSAGDIESAVSISRQCKWTQHKPDNEKPSPGKKIEVIAVVILKGLTSAKGALLNGCEASVKAHCPATNSYDITLISPPADTHPTTIRVKREKIEKEVTDEKDNSTYVHYGIGCDSCGVFPIRGRRYKGQDCSEEVGFDLCGDCFDAGCHTRTSDDATTGRFNQHHLPDHRMKKMARTDSLVHQLQAANPDVPLQDLLSMLGLALDGISDS